jgi:glycosyltransferase involved in cell wall biosynthesis
VPRIAFIDYFPTHYRRGLYEEIGRRADADFYFFADERERWWNPRLSLVEEGTFRRIDLPRYRIGGEAVMPGVARRILAGRYDAVIKSPNGKLMLPLVYGAAKARGTAFVLWTGMWMHPTTRFHRASKPLMEGIYRGSDAIVTYGEHVRQFVLETAGVAPEKVFVAGQAVDPSRFAAVQPARAGQAPEILFIGQFEERKGVTYLLDAIRRLSDTQVRLRLVGSGADEDRLRAYAGDDQRIEFLGHRSQDELPSELARARCLVLPSVTTELDKEPWGLVVNEAFHAGVPVIATDGVGAAAGGLVRHGRNGFVVPERDSVALADALLPLVEDASLASRMGEAGREDVAAFNYDRMATAFLSAVDFALASRAFRR